jgi:hypothetical protein
MDGHSLQSKLLVVHTEHTPSGVVDFFFKLKFVSTCFISLAMSSSEWSKELLVDFISCYKQYNCLWQLKSKEYTNRNLKNKAYARLVDF